MSSEGVGAPLLPSQLGCDKVVLRGPFLQRRLSRPPLVGPSHPSFGLSDNEMELSRLFQDGERLGKSGGKLAN
jgi:hypothetical protein